MDPRTPPARTGDEHGDDRDDDRGNDRGDDRGFTLFEVIVAFTIAALAVAALLRGAGTGLAAAHTAAQVQDATSRARSRLAVLSAGPLRPGEQNGAEAGGFRWRTTVQPVALAPGLALYALTASVSWSEGAGGEGARRQVTLSTQKVGVPPPRDP